MEGLELRSVRISACTLPYLDCRYVCQTSTHRLDPVDDCPVVFRLDEELFALGSNSDDVASLQVVSSETRLCTLEGVVSDASVFASFGEQRGWSMLE